MQKKPNEEHLQNGVGSRQIFLCSSPFLALISGGCKIVRHMTDVHVVSFTIDFLAPFVVNVPSRITEPTISGLRGEFCVFSIALPYGKWT